MIDMLSVVKHTKSLGFSQESPNGNRKYVSDQKVGCIRRKRIFICRFMCVNVNCMEFNGIFETSRLQNTYVLLIDIMLLIVFMIFWYGKILQFSLRTYFIEVITMYRFTCTNVPCIRFITTKRSFIGIHLPFPQQQHIRMFIHWFLDFLLM